MFADDKSIENFQQLFFEFKKYLELQKEYTKLELTEKLTILFSTLIMVLVLIILGMVALFYLLFALAYVLEPLVGGLMAPSQGPSQRPFGPSGTDQRKTQAVKKGCRTCDSLFLSLKLKV